MRSQVTAFAVLGLVTVIFIAFTYYVLQMSAQSDTDPERFFVNTPIDLFIDACMRNTLQPHLETIIKKGGSLNASLHMQHGFVTLHYNPLSNQLITPQSAGQELRSAMLSKLQECIALDPYETIGYTTESTFNGFTITVAKETIVMTLLYDVSLTRNNDQILQSVFRTEVSSLLGTYLEDARVMVNTALVSSVDADLYRKETNRGLKIERPYPFTVFHIIGPQETFSFAIEEQDISFAKFSNPSLVYEPQMAEDQGACVVNEACYGFTKDAICALQEGTMRLNERCSISNQRIESNQIGIGASCDSWFDVYSGSIVEETRLDGESWCSFEQGVGARFYKLSCVDGIVVAEPCADFKDDICIQESLSHSSGEMVTRATCTANDFWICNACETENCCDQGNCVWTETNTCIPLAEPGFKFWQTDTATALCSIGNCGLNGDCGNKFNFVGDRSAPDYRSYSELQAQALRSARTIPPRNAFAIFQEQLPRFSFLDVFNERLSVIDSFMFNRFQTLEESADFCPVWTPLQNACDLCHSDGYDVCTEYKCRSLGNCLFEVQDGVPLCNFPEEQQGDLEKSITFNREATGRSSVFGSGVSINTRLHETLSFRIETSQDALCKVSLLPDQNFFAIESRDLTNHEYGQNHSFEITLTHSFNIVNTIQQYFGVSNLRMILPELVSLKYMLESNPQSSATEQRIAGMITPIVRMFLSENIYDASLESFDITALQQTSLAASSLEKIIALLEYIDSEEYYLFFTCIDRSGRQTADLPVRLSLSLCDDTTLPEIDYAITTDTIRLQLSKPSECRWSYDNISYALMENNISCSLNPYTPYVCTFENNFGHDVEGIYVACLDRPEFADRWYNISVNDSLVLATETDFSDKESGNYTIAPNTITFGLPFACEGVLCGSTVCAINQSTWCEPKRPVCPTQTRNEHSIFVELKEPSIYNITLSLEGNFLTATPNFSGSCGFRTSPDEAYRSMQAQGSFNFTHTFRTLDGIQNLSVVCYNNDVIKHATFRD